MLKPIQNVPLDYSLCNMTVTVYHREGLTRQVIENAHYEWTDRREVADGIEEKSRSFHLVVPGECRIYPGDKVLLGIGPEIFHWEDLLPETCDTLGLVTSVQPRHYKGQICHTEARG